MSWRLTSVLDRKGWFCNTGVATSLTIRRTSRRDSFQKQTASLGSSVAKIGIEGSQQSFKFQPSNLNSQASILTSLSQLADDSLHDLSYLLRVNWLVDVAAADWFVGEPFGG